MKKILTAIAALAMAAGLASCQKENVTGNGGNNNAKSLRATFADQTTKVSYGEVGDDLQPTWEGGETVLGIDSESNPFTLTVSSVKDNVATLTGSKIPEGGVILIYVSGVSMADWDATNKKYVISYSDQNGDKTMPAIMTAKGTITDGNGEFEFDNDGAVLGIYNVGADLKGKTIKQVALYGTDIASSADIFYGGVTFNNANDGHNVISTKVLDSGITVGDEGALGKEILMAVPAGAKVNKVIIRTTEDEVYSLAASNETPMAAGTYRFIRTGKFEPDLPASSTGLENYIGIVWDWSI